jgi:hypothetical protein
MNNNKVSAVLRAYNTYMYSSRVTGWAYENILLFIIMFILYYIMFIRKTFEK